MYKLYKIYNMPNCEYCKKSLVMIGNNRKNGKNNIDDWKTRKYHKKCYAILMNLKKLKEMADKFYEDENENENENESDYE